MIEAKTIGAPANSSEFRKSAGSLNERKTLLAGLKEIKALNQEIEAFKAVEKQAEEIQQFIAVPSLFISMNELLGVWVPDAPTRELIDGVINKCLSTFNDYQNKLKRRNTSGKILRDCVNEDRDPMDMILAARGINSAHDNVKKAHRSWAETVIEATEILYDPGARPLSEQEKGTAPVLPAPGEN